MVKNNLKRFGESTNICDANGNELFVGDRVELDGEPGTVVYGWGTFGIEMDSCIDPHCCAFDTSFCTFEDLMWNNDPDNLVCPNVQKQPTFVEDSAL